MKRNERIKRAYTPTEYTPEQLAEIHKCMYGYTDLVTGEKVSGPVYFAEKYVRIEHPTRGDVPFIMYDYQKEMLDMFRTNNKSIVMSARQTGKKLSIDELIPTPSGFTKMGDLQVGDIVLGADGNPTTIEAVSDITTNGTSYEIHFSTGEVIKADADHMWEVEDKYGSKKTNKVRILTTQQMVDIGVTIGNKNESRFKVKVAQPLNLPPQNLLIDPYTLGVWLGDGTSNAHNITLHENDIEISTGMVGYDVAIKSLNCHPNHILTMSLQGMNADLRAIGVFDNKHIPMTYLRGSYDQRLALLQGLMDTDGTVDGMGRGGCEITLANERLARDCMQLISTLGLKPTITHRIVKGFERWEVRFMAYRSEIEVFRLKRKLDRMKHEADPSRYMSTKKRSIQKIIQIDNIPMRCIRVDNSDKLFLVGDTFIPTHNSVSSGVYLLWFAIFHTNATILIASNKNSNAMEMIKRIQFSYEYLPLWLKPGILDDGWNKHALGFDNGSRILSQATSGNTGRGLAITLLFLDEFAFVRPSIQEEFWTSILPTLSTGGACIITSTPNGSTDKFSAIWRAATLNSNTDDMQFAHMHVKWDAPPGRDDKFRRNQIKLLGQAKWDQEYECKFISNDPLLIDPIVLATAEDMIKPSLSTNNLGFDFYQTIRSGRTYLIGIDPSTGTNQDFSTLVCYDFADMSLVAMLRTNNLNSPQLYATCKWFFNYIKSQGANAYFTVENNGIGEGFIALYENDEKFPEGIDFITEEEGNRLGFRTEGRVKLRMCLAFKQLVEAGRIDICEARLIKELKSFVVTKGSYAAQIGATDDIISAILLVVRLLSEISIYEQKAFDVMNQFEELTSTGPIEEGDVEESYDDNYVPDGFIM